MTVMAVQNPTESDRIGMAALVIRCDAIIGYPKPPRNYDPADGLEGWTMTCAQPQMTDTTTLAVVVTDEMVMPVDEVLSAARAKVQNGTATAIDAAIAALPDPL